MMPAQHALRPDRTIDPKAYRLTESGCHIWVYTTQDGSPVARLHGRRITVRQWLLDLPLHSQVTVSCGNRLCVNPDHCAPLVRKPPTVGSKLMARRKQLEQEAQQVPVGQMRELRRVRADIARLLVAIPTGVISDETREDLQSYVDGATYAEIGKRRGTTRQAVENRLRRADRDLRIAEHAKQGQEQS
jgi:hypothetical protein